MRSLLRNSLAVAVLVLGLLFGLAPAVQAHNVPGSALMLDIGEAQIDAELRLPLSELEIAFGQPLAAAPDAALARHRQALEGYIRKHLALRGAIDQAWTMELRSLAVATNEAQPDLVAQLRLVPPAGVPVRQFMLHSDAIAHEVMNHRTLVLVRRDWGSATFAQQPRVLATLGFQHHDEAIDLGPGGPLAGLRATFVLGAEHIAAGTDHLLFLLVLLLPAPLRAVNRRWGAAGGTRRCVAALLKIVTAFTLGHSLTLVAAAAGWLRLPAAPVEALIAASILVSAAHALRPLFPGREAFVAAGFGLVHGLAFGSVVAELGLSGGALAWAMLGFNLGIEAMQLVVVAAVVPWLMLASRTPTGRCASCWPQALRSSRQLGWPSARWGLPTRWARSSSRGRRTRAGVFWRWPCWR
jgi:hypothetical protein